MHRIAPLIALAAMACTADNATITDGAYVGFFPVSTSRVVLDNDVKFEEGQVNFNIDCRDDADRTLADPRPICGGGTWPPEHEGWAAQDGFRVMSEKFETWRGEAIMTNEDDFQISFHQRLPGGEDFRFAIVVDPFFQPVECVQDGSGGVELQPVDGDWIENWSADLDDNERYEPGTLFYLNSSAYQFNPSDTRETWTLPRNWRAGYARGRFGPEDMFRRTTRFGLPNAYSVYELADEANPEPDPSELFYDNSLDVGDDPNSSGSFQSLISRAERVATDSRDEFNMMVGDELDALGLEKPFLFEPMIHTNAWRAPDGQPAGLDAWVGIEYNWIRFDDSSTFEVGGSASGEFFLTFEAAESHTRVMVQGSFTADNIRKDRWVTDRVDEIKLEENGTIICGELAGGDD